MRSSAVWFRAFIAIEAQGVACGDLIRHLLCGLRKCHLPQRGRQWGAAVSFPKGSLLEGAGTRSVTEGVLPSTGGIGTTIFYMGGR